MRMYLAHPIAVRKDVRREELMIEERTGVELVNPFYDTGRDDIHRIDRGEIDRWEVPCRPLVDEDISLICDTDALVAVLCDGLSIGTIMEMVYAYQAKTPVYVIDLCGKGPHPWVRYHSTRTFTSWRDFENVLKEGLL